MSTLIVTTLNTERGFIGFKERNFLFSESGPSLSYLRLVNARIALLIVMVEYLNKLKERE